MNIFHLLCLACLGFCLSADAQTGGLLDDIRDQDTEIKIPISRTDMTITESIQSAVREWATAIRISLIARLISLVSMWLALSGLMVLFGL